MAIFATTFSLKLVVGIFGVSVIFFISKWLVISVFQIDKINQDEAILALYLAAGIVFFLMLSQIYNAVLQGIHRFDVYSNIFNVNTIVMLSGNIYLALSGYISLNGFIVSSVKTIRDNPPIKTKTPIINKGSKRAVSLFCVTKDCELILFID